MNTIVEIKGNQLTALMYIINGLDIDQRALRLTIGTDQHGPFYQTCAGQAGMWSPRIYTDWVEEPESVWVHKDNLPCTSKDWTSRDGLTVCHDHDRRIYATTA